jgi:hypothetical protein
MYCSTVQHKSGSFPSTLMCNTAVGIMYLLFNNARFLVTRSSVAY